MNKTKKTIIFLTILSFLALPVILMADNIDSTYKYSWGENIGWMNWKPSYGGTDYGVTVYNECLTGYIWAENAGWIKVGDTSCTGSDCCQSGTSYGYENDSNGTDDDGDGVVDDWGVNNDGNGNLSGYAWGENVGWINFKPNYDGSDHPVVINSNGEFTNYAWGENVGWINMNCANTNYCGTVDFKVKTTWTANQAPQVVAEEEKTPPVGVAIPGQFQPPTSPIGGFRILINEGEEYTDSRTVTLNLTGGPDTARMAISNYPDFREAVQEPYTPTKIWTLSEGEGERTVYAKFYTQWGRASKIVSDSIILIEEKPIEEITVEEIRAEILEIQQKLIEILIQLIQLIQEQIDQLQAQLPHQK